MTLVMSCNWNNNQKGDT